MFMILPFETLTITVNIARYNSWATVTTSFGKVHELTVPQLIAALEIAAKEKRGQTNVPKGHGRHTWLARVRQSAAARDRDKIRRETEAAGPHIKRRFTLF